MGLEMRKGKVAQNVWKRSIQKPLQTEAKINGSQAAHLPVYGQGGATLRVTKEEEMVFTSNPQMIVSESLPKRAVCRAVNDLAACGCEAVGILVTLLFPEGWPESWLRDTMRGLAKACSEQQIAVLGGHTQGTNAVETPLLQVTGVGRKGMKPSVEQWTGLDIVVTKWIGLEGTILLADLKEEKLRSRFPQTMIDQAKSYVTYLSVRSEAALAGKSGICAMQDLSEGGVFGGLWELAERTGVGLDVDLKRIPLRQETVEICEFFGLNPYELCAQGSLLLFAEDGTALVRELEQQQIHATVIGKTTDKNDRILRNEEERRYLEPPKMDEIYRIF